MATLEQLEAALRKADAAGNAADAKVFASEIRRMRGSGEGMPSGREAQPEPSAPSSVASTIKTTAGAALPYATAATAGAALGALGGPAAPITVPAGAMAGMGALALTDLASGLYNVAATPFGAKPIPSGSEAMRNVYAKAGMYQEPSTPAERLQAAATEGALSGVGGVGAAVDPVGHGGRGRGAGQSRGPFTRPLKPKTRRSPLKGTRRTSLLSPGSKRMAVPAAMSSR